MVQINRKDRTWKIRFAAMEEIGVRQRVPLYICSAQTTDRRFPECPPHFLFFICCCIIDINVWMFLHYAPLWPGLRSGSCWSHVLCCLSTVNILTWTQEAAVCVDVLADEVRGTAQRWQNVLLEPGGASASRCTTAPLRAMSVRWDLERLFKVLANCCWAWFGALRMQ